MSEAQPHVHQPQEDEEEVSNPEVERDKLIDTMQNAGWTWVQSRTGRKKKKFASRGELAMVDTHRPQELCSVSSEHQDSDIWFTIDSGASENVIGPDMAPQFPTRPSKGSREGLSYVTANGSFMPNRGEKEMRVTTAEGNHCMLRMQVTDVHKPLMSVARICDAGHEVTFKRNGGVIVNEDTGASTAFARVDNVYRLCVNLSPNAAPGFTRQER